MSDSIIREIVNFDVPSGVCDVTFGGATFRADVTNIELRRSIDAISEDVGRALRRGENSLFLDEEPRAIRCEFTVRDMDRKDVSRLLRALEKSVKKERK